VSTLHEALSRIQSQLNAPKCQTNSFGGYKYRSCEDILQAVKPLLGVLTLTISDDIQAVGDRVYVKATVTMSDGQTSITTTAYAREALTKKGMDESQITGSTSSYARKYALNGLLLIDDNKDADTRDNTNADQERKDAAANAKEQSRQNSLSDAVHALRNTIEAIKEGIESGDLSTASEAWFELTAEEKQSIWVAKTKGGPFTTQERTTMQSQEFRLANRNFAEAKPTGMFQGAKK
jgi:hypothetical protein